VQKLPDISQHFSNGIEVRDNEPVEGAIKKFKREVANSGILTELKKREYYEKPSVIRRRERVQAERKRLRKKSMYGEA
jgi:small subunit ribosomal protein S21